jgi:hypothetical protein
MRTLFKSAILFTSLALAGCAKPVPPEKAAYVGEWTSTAMALLITQDGSVAYRRLHQGANKSIDAPLKEFQGDNFVVGLGPVSTTFVVSAPPHVDGGVWKMTVDGVELRPPTFAALVQPAAGACRRTVGGSNVIELASYLLTGSAALLLVLGGLHLLYTFHGPKLLPRDAELQQHMSAVSPVITRETTMWKAWIGFNATHSFGAILFGLVYGYLALLHPSFLFESAFLLVVGFVLLGGYTFLGVRYWFSVPFRGILFSLVLYASALVSAAV